MKFYPITRRDGEQEQDKGRSLCLLLPKEEALQVVYLLTHRAFWRREGMRERLARAVLCEARLFRLSHSARCKPHRL